MKYCARSPLRRRYGHRPPGLWEVQPFNISCMPSAISDAAMSVQQRGTLAQSLDWRNIFPHSGAGDRDMVSSGCLSAMSCEH